MCILNHNNLTDLYLNLFIVMQYKTFEKKYLKKEFKELIFEKAVNIT